MKPNDRATIITGTIAKPSNPSVKLTALAEPMITKIPKGIKNSPKSNIKFLKNGKLMIVFISLGKKEYIRITIIEPNRICNIILVVAFSPLLFCECIFL